MRITKIIISLFLLLFTSSCVDEYFPTLDKYQNLLVVDGQLTNGSQPVTVRLSYSSTVSKKEFIPVSGAELFVSDENQVRTSFYESEPGNYTPIDSTFRGQIGSTYQLNISLSDGRNYVSDTCRLMLPAPIDTVYGLIEAPIFSNQNHEYPGIQFYVNNHNVVNDTSYYVWKLSQTYKYRSSFDIDYTWEGEYIPYPNPDSLRTCFKTSTVKELLFASTQYLDPTAVNQFPLHFVATNTKALSIRYSVLVRQLRIPEKAFNFYEAIDEQNFEQGEDLWSKQPVQIRGNIHNINNDDEPVLGYFLVAGSTEERIFVNRPDIPFYYTECTPDFDLRWVPFSSPSQWPIYINDIMSSGWGTADSPSCFDCRLSGGSLTPPDFWE